MELIYTDENFNDIGVLKEATCDFAFGSDENDFEIITTKKSAKLIVGGFVYYENTEYGGIVDSVKASNNSDEITYNGRTWHGLLNSFIMRYESEYLNYDGVQYTVLDDVVATDLVSELIEKTNLPFTVVEFEETLTPVSVDARLPMYDFLTLVLRASDMKIYFRHDKGIKLYVSGATQYDDEHNFDYKQFSLTATKGRKFTNHFLLHYHNDETSEHKYLDLYTDEVGNIQPYALIENPLRDDDYIYTDENKIIEGKYEVVSMLEETSSKENYRLETNSIPPLQWNYTYSNYYEYVLKEGSQDEYEFKQLTERDFEYQADTKPLNWESQWNTFYKRPLGTQDNLVQLSDEDIPQTDRYIAITRAQYTAPPVEPHTYWDAKKWNDSWSNTYTRSWDGNQWAYTQTQGKENKKPVKLGSQPSDWGSNKGGYYVNDTITYYSVEVYGNTKSGKVLYDTIDFNSFNANKTKISIMTSAQGGKSKKVKILSLVSKLGQSKKINGGTTTLKMVKKQTVSGLVTIETYCKRRGRSVGGANSGFKFSEVSAVYRLDSADPTAPTFEEANTSHVSPKGYFIKQSSTTSRYPSYESLVLQYEIWGKTKVPPPYAKSKYYLKVNDHFANMIEKAKEQLTKELDELESATGSLNIETYEFDVGDMLGGINPLTNEPFKSVVTKKIAKIDSFKAEVSYEIG